MTRDDITDRELLELAAKAAGIERDEDGEFCIQPHQDDCRWWDDDFCTCGAIWNPLKDDGDALRLAVKLEINLSFSQDCAFGFWIGTPKDGEDLSSHARRAIVRAAAEIGRNMT
jgi:hypothetical protein